jgi:hypothetical protein
MSTHTQEMQDFNLDDQCRVRWDPMLKKAWLLQSGPDVAHSCDQLVVYLRRWVGTDVTKLSLGQGLKLNRLPPHNPIPP